MEPGPIRIEKGNVTVNSPKDGVWLTKNEIARLFGVYVPAIVSNIRTNRSLHPVSLPLDDPVE